MSARDYKPTLRLPDSPFSMKADLAKREPQWLERWKSNATYRAAMDAAILPPFVFHDGPPYANGDMHYGHVLNNTLKDFVTRFRLSVGHSVRFVPGWDCHGLPIEQNIERKLGAKKRELSTQQLRALCRDEAQKWVQIQSEQRQRIGMLGTWDEPYLTMQPRFEAQVMRALASFVDKGLLYRGRKPVWWSTAERTALAESELEYEEGHRSPSVYVRFAATQSAVDLLAKRFPTMRHSNVSLSAVIWTTTPWTLPANRALAVNPALEYVLLERPNDAGLTEYLLVAAALAESFIKACGWGAPESLPRTMHGAGEPLLGAELVGLAFLHPFESRESPIVSADYVEATAGTGVVHTAPGHGRDDYMTGTRNGLVVDSPVDDGGAFTEELGPVAQSWGLVGKHVFDGNPIIVEQLAALGVLCNRAGEEIVHSYPISWRSKKPLITRATVQWFIALDEPMASGAHQGRTLRDVALTEIDRLAAEGHAAAAAERDACGWVPAWGRERIHGMIAARPDWCISRQRAWGLPIPALHCVSCEKATITRALIEHVAAIVQAKGADAWYDPEVDVIPAGFACEHCGKSDGFTRDQNILDVWFESGSSFFAVCSEGKDLRIPVDLYLEGSDQHRGWFHSSLLVGIATLDQAPYNTVVTHGFVGEKVQRTLPDGRVKEQLVAISKSVINEKKSRGEDVSVYDPMKVIATDGAEILRLWVASNDFTGDVGLSARGFQQVREGYRAIRNVLRFLLQVLRGESPTPIDQLGHDLEPLDRWALGRLSALVTHCEQSYRRYEFRAVIGAVTEFVSDMSGFYLDVSKDWLYNDAPSSPRVRSSLAVIDAMARGLAMVLAPILPFTAEDLWDHLPKRTDDPTSVHLCRWKSLAEVSDFDALAQSVADIRAIRERVQGALEPMLQAWGAEKSGATKEQREPGADSARWPESARIDHARDVHATVEITLDESSRIAALGPVLSECLLLGDLTLRTGDSRLPPVIARGSTVACVRCRRRLPNVAASTSLCPRCTHAVDAWDAAQP
ncbi:MAG: isoleucine--tRNA ligase [Deltaproteobacteria bacterium]|nr:isoleucine--tRNA ligase [Deltaproteobacteria bacterium]